MDSRFSKTASALCAAALAAAMPAATAADVNVWTGAVNDWDWTEPQNFQNGAPAAGDEVQLPAGTSVHVTNDASYAVVTTLKRLRPMAKSVVVHFDVPAGRERDVDCAINYAGNLGSATHSRYGTVVKTGGGTLTLTSKRDEYYKTGARDYITALTVEEGVLRGPTNFTTSSTYVMGCLTVSNNAAFHMPSCNMFRSFGLFGGPESLVTNALQSSVDYDVANTDKGVAEPSVFAGAIGGKIRWYASGRVMLTGTRNTMPSDMGVTLNNGAGEAGSGVTGLMTFGMRGQPSSAGAGSLFLTRTGGGGFLYLGNGETTDRGVQLWDSTSGPSFIDGGAHGGLLWTGGLTSSSDTHKQHLFFLTGSNSVPCQWSGTVQFRDRDGGCSAHIAKRGTGTWWLRSAASGMRGVWAVDNGTLMFDSIAERGVDCSLGRATVLKEARSDFPSNMTDVAYAFTLGTATTEGALDYRGATAALCTTRPALLKGAGRIVNSSAADFAFAGVSSADGVEGTLVLDGGVDATNNVVSAVSDGGGVTSVAKEGAGTWKLGDANCAFSGDVAVRAGKLKVAGALPFTWYKWTITRGNASDKVIGCYEFALYDEEGVRQNGGLTYSSSPAASLAPGQAGIELGYPNATFSWTVGKVDVGALFDDNTPRWTLLASTNTVTYKPAYADPQSWISVVMRLPQGAKPVASYDFAPFSNGNTRRILGYILYGSVDGVNWEVVDDDYAANLTSLPSSENIWYFSRTAQTAGTASPHEGGKAIRSLSQTATAPLAGVRSVSVAEGAVLEAEYGAAELSSLRIDATGAGTLRNIAFAESGTLDVANLPHGCSVLPGTYENCTGLENIENWALTFDGGDPRTKRVRCVGGALHIVRSETVLFFR